MKDKLKALLARVEATRSTLDGAVAELEELEQELKVLINGPNTWGAKHIAKSRGKMPAAKPKAAEPPRRPKHAAISADLHNVLCPKCGGPMHWRWSEAKGKNFAGCVRFPDCRGARSEAEVSAGVRATVEPARKPAPPARVSEAAVEMQKRLDDIAVKHHGPDAPAELAAASGEAFVGLDGRVHYHDDDDLGVPF